MIFIIGVGLFYTELFSLGILKTTFFVKTYIEYNTFLPPVNIDNLNIYNLQP